MQTASLLLSKTTPPRKWAYCTPSTARSFFSIATDAGADPYHPDCPSLGVGALSSPLVATQFSQITHWSFHYLVSLGIALSNVIVLIAVFRFKDQDSLCLPYGALPTYLLIDSMTSSLPRGDRSNTEPRRTEHDEQQVLSNIRPAGAPSVGVLHPHLCWRGGYAGWYVYHHSLMLRVVDPDARTGWIVTYVIQLRGGGPSSGYISSGFFGGE